MGKKTVIEDNPLHKVTGPRDITRNLPGIMSNLPLIISYPLYIPNNPAGIISNMEDIMRNT
jgi:hypothetical protein